MVWILFFGFIGLMLVRVPVTMAIGVATLAALLVAGYGDALYIIPQQILEGVYSPALLAVPYFILAGNLMNVVGMTDKIFNFALALVGHFRAGLAQVNVLASMIFAGVSGVAVADCAGLGTLEVKAMREHGYPVAFAAALSIVSAIVGPIIPPSVVFVIYAYIANVSVGRMFLAGIVPGILIGISLMIYNRIIADRRGFPREPRASLRQVARSAVDGIAALVAPAIIIGAILTGFTTATEAGVLACAYSLLIGALYRTLDWRKLWAALTDTMVISAVIMIIIGFSHIMGWLMAIERIPQEIASGLVLFTDDRAVFLALLLSVLLLLGCVVEGVPLLLILTPMLLPVVDHFGVDRVHFGVVMCFAMLIGIATPPMGIGLYIMAEVAKVSFEKVSLAVLPLLLPLIIVLVLVAYIPALTLWLPNLVMGAD